MIANSSMADKVAEPHKIKAVTVNPNVPYKSGKKNRRIPASLFAYVCKKEKARYFVKPTVRDRKRTRIIAPIQYDIHKGH